MGVWMNARGNLTRAWAETLFMTSRSPIGGEQPAAPTDANVLANFESPQEAEILLERWQISTPTGATGHSLGELHLISPGAASTAHALRFKGHIEPTPGAGQGSVGVQYTFSLTPRGQGRRGFQFEVRGDRRLFQVRIEPPTSALAAPALSFVPDSDWQTVRLPTAWLANPVGSLPSAQLGYSKSRSMAHPATSSWTSTNSVCISTMLDDLPVGELPLLRVWDRHHRADWPLVRRQAL
jgi:hypothetical protein